MTLLGSQVATIESVPSGGKSYGPIAVAVAAEAGLELFPWQKRVLDLALKVDADGHWMTPKVGLVVPRQNGKTELAAALSLFWMFMSKEPLIIFTAHQFNTAADAYRRIKGLIQGSPELDSRVAKYLNGHGYEGIKVYSEDEDGNVDPDPNKWRELSFKARSVGSGRGFSASRLILDEAYDIPDSVADALMPTLAAKKNSQAWFMSSPVNQQHHKNGFVLAGIRKAGMLGDPDVAYFEWSADESDDFADPRVHAKANPSYGRTLQPRALESNFRVMSRSGFGAEHLGIGDWPDLDAASRTVIDMDLWRDIEDQSSRIVGRCVFAVDVSYMSEKASISVAGLNADGKIHVELVDSRKRTGWLLDRLRQLNEQRAPLAFVVDQRSAAGSLALDMEAAGLPTMVVDAMGVTQSFATFLTKTVDERAVVHIGQDELTSAIEGAKTRTVGDGGASAWDRKSPDVDITPIVSATFALWGFTVKQNGFVDAASCVW